MANSASTADSIVEAHQRLRANPDIQFNLPEPEQVQPRKPPDLSWLKWLDGIGTPAAWVVWTLVALAAAFVLFLIVRALIARYGQGEAAVGDRGEAARWRPEEKVARALLAEADALAAQGRYDEAARLLLHRSLEDIRKRKPKLLRPALTSREIGLIDALPLTVRGTFQVMARAVERSLFAGRALGREAWEEARAAYDAFALQGNWA